MRRRMFCVILIADGRTEALAATASACVTAVAEGLVGHGVIVSPGKDPGAAKIADAMGADLAGSLAEAVPLARGEWALILAAGDIPSEGWMGDVERLALLGASSGYLPHSQLDRFTRRLMALAGLPARVGPGIAAPLAALRSGALGVSVVLPVLRRRVARP